MKLSYLREFVALSNTLNFSQTAKLLNMTQPGLSRHISIIERDVGIKLFIRDTHRVLLTREGEQFLTGIQRVIEDYDAVCASVTKGNLQALTIGVPYYGVKSYLSRVMGAFATAYPKVNITYLPAYPDEIITALLSLRADVAVLPRVDFFNAERLTFQDVFREPLVIMLNRTHPLADRHGLTLDDLKNEQLISLKGNWGDAICERLQEHCRHRGIAPPKRIKEADSVEAAALDMTETSGLMVLPAHFREANISGNVTCVNILDEHCALTVSLARHPANPNPVIDTFIRFYLDQKTNPATGDCPGNDPR